MDTLWSPCSRSASAAWLLAGRSRWSSELFVEQAIFLESVVVVDPLLAEAAAEDPRELDLDLCQSLWRLQGQKRRRLLRQESMRVAWVSREGLVGPPYRPSRPLLSETFVWRKV